MPGPRLSPLTHIFVFILAVLIGGIAFTATTATAATGVTYRAQLATPVDAGKFVVRDIIWHCEGTSCIAGQSGSRPAIVCALLVRKTGPLTGFSIDGAEFAADALARCNDRK